MCVCCVCECKKESEYFDEETPPQKNTKVKLAIKTINYIMK